MRGRILLWLYSYLKIRCTQVIIGQSHGEWIPKYNGLGQGDTCHLSSLPCLPMTSNPNIPSSSTLLPLLMISPFQNPLQYLHQLNQLPFQPYVYTSVDMDQLLQESVSVKKSDQLSICSPSVPTLQPAPIAIQGTLLITTANALAFAF